MTVHQYSKRVLLRFDPESISVDGPICGINISVEKNVEFNNNNERQRERERERERENQLRHL